MEDNKIITLFMERQEQAITELSNKYGVNCTQVARNILNDMRDIEECVNDSYLGAWNTIPPQVPKSLRAYICGIVRNLAINRYHLNSALKRNSNYDVSLNELENCFSVSFSMEDTLSVGEISKHINTFLGKLDKENRIMFVRRYWHADSIGDIAELLGVSKHTVSVRLSRTREKLRKYLEKEGVHI